MNNAILDEQSFCGTKMHMNTTISSSDNRCQLKLTNAELSMTLDDETIWKVAAPNADYIHIGVISFQRFF